MLKSKIRKAPFFSLKDMMLLPGLPIISSVPSTQINLFLLRTRMWNSLKEKLEIGKVANTRVIMLWNSSGWKESSILTQETWIFEALCRKIHWKWEGDWQSKIACEKHELSSQWYLRRGKMIPEFIYKN